MNSMNNMNNMNQNSFNNLNNSVNYNMNNYMNLNNYNFNNGTNMNNMNMSNLNTPNISNSNNYSMNMNMNGMNNNLNNSINVNNNMNNNFNNINNINMLNSKSSPTPNFNNQVPALIGLDNIGSTCFMNATLQCLSQIGKLSKYFLADKNKNEIINNNIAKTDRNALQLSPAYLDLIKHLWNKNEPNRSYSPYNIMTTISKMNNLIKLGEPGDSKDFIIFILEQLHTELKRPCKNYKPTCTIPLNQYDRTNTFNHFLDEFKKELSVISDLFFGVQETRNECLNCKNNFNLQGKNNPILYNFQIFNLLIFPLEEVRQMRNKNYGNMYINNDTVTLDDCFAYNNQIELFTGQNQNHCNICNKLSDCNYATYIFSSPTILILILNRGKDNKYKVKLDFREVIDITNFVEQKEANKRLLYDLIGVVTHCGQSGPNAHFVASCKSSVNNKWYKFNDSLVNIIDNVQNDVINYANPYILFYKKID